MDSKNISQNKNEENKHIEFNGNFKKIKSDYFLQNLFNYLQKNKSLEIIKYNKKIQNRLNISIKDFKECSQTYTSIEIEIIPTKNKYGKFINIEKGDEAYYHIYFNDNMQEIKKYVIDKDDYISKIKIKIDYQIKSFEKLFYHCECIESINFEKFYRNN